MKNIFILLTGFFALNVFAVTEIDPTSPNAKVVFEKKTLVLGSQKILVEIADTSDRAARGLMYRKSLTEGNGMLFVFPNAQTRSFWMKNTFIPLAIGYFNSKRELIDVHEMVPAQSEMQMNYPTYVSKEPAQYALEVPTGWFSKHKIKPRQTFQLIEK